MFCEPDKELMQKIADSGISRKEICNLLQIKYGNLSNWLNGFNPMPTRVRMRILKLIEEREGGEK